MRSSMRRSRAKSAVIGSASDTHRHQWHCWKPGDETNRFIRTGTASEMRASGWTCEKTGGMPNEFYGNQHVQPESAARRKARAKADAIPTPIRPSKSKRAPMPVPTHIILMPEGVDSRYESWRKHVTGIDASKKGGFAYIGPWLEVGLRAELPEGAVVLVADESGTRRNHPVTVRLQRVERGKLRPVAVAVGKDWGLQLKETAMRLLAGPLKEAGPSEGRPFALEVEDHQNRLFDPSKTPTNASSVRKPRRATRKARPGVPPYTGTVCPISGGRAGKHDKVVMPDGTRIPVQHMLVPVESVIPSHGKFDPKTGRASLNSNAKEMGKGGYPGERQPDGTMLNANFTRDYANDTGFVDRMEKLFNDPLGEGGKRGFDPDLLTSITPSANLGAPIVGCVGGNFVVLGGNNRTNILQRMYASKQPTHRTAYRENLEDLGGFLGFQKEDVGAVTRPIHVRVVADDHTPSDFGSLVGLMHSMNAAEAAASPARDAAMAALGGITDTQLETLADIMRDLGDGELASVLAKPTDAVEELADWLRAAGLLLSKDTRLWQDTDGSFTTEGSTKIQEILLALAVPDNSALALLSQYKLMRSGFVKSAPTLVSLSRHDPEFHASLMTALREFANWLMGGNTWKNYWHGEVVMNLETGARQVDSRWKAATATVQRLLKFIQKNHTKQNVWPKTFRDYLGVVTGVTQRELEEANTSAIPGFGPVPDARTADEQLPDVFTLDGRRRRMVGDAPDWIGVDKWIPAKHRRHLASVYMLDRIVVGVNYFTDREKMREWGKRFSDEAKASSRTNVHIMTMRWAARGRTVGDWVADSQQTGTRYTKSKSTVWPSKLSLAGDGVLRVIRETRGQRDAVSKFRRKSILDIGTNERAWQADSKARTADPQFATPKPKPRPRGEQPTLFGRRASQSKAEWVVWQDARGQYVRARA